MKPAVTLVVLAGDTEARFLVNHGGAGLTHVSALKSDRSSTAEFARIVADAMTEAVDDCGYTRIMLAAPPEMLAELRARLPRQTARLVDTELEKDLVATPMPDLAGHFDAAAAL